MASYFSCQVSGVRCQGVSVIQIRSVVGWSVLVGQCWSVSVGQSVLVSQVKSSQAVDLVRN